MRSFSLHVEPAPAGLAELGDVVELREIPHGLVRTTLVATEQEPDQRDRLVAACLHVDGERVGYAALQALPGRFTRALQLALEQCMRMHGLDAAPDPAAAPAAAGDEAPKA